MPIKFHGEVFKSKAELIRRTRKVRDRYIGKPRVDAVDEPFVAALFAANPGYREKVAGRRVSHFEVRTYIKGTDSFFAVFTDGSFIDFSFYKSIDSISDGQLADP